MNKKELIPYWVETAKRDYHTMLNLYRSKDYHWSLFMGHLVIEKLLKALYVQNVSNNPPRTHDLLRLADECKINTTEEQKDLLDFITTFNISARYPDYEQSFYKKCTCDFTFKNIKKIKELKKWLMSLLEHKLNI